MRDHERMECQAPKLANSEIGHCPQLKWSVLQRFWCSSSSSLLGDKKASVQCVQCMITRLECPASTSANRLETSAIVVMFMRMIATGVDIILSMGSWIKKNLFPIPEDKARLQRQAGRQWGASEGWGRSREGTWERKERAPTGTSGWGYRTKRRTLSSLVVIHYNYYFEAVIAPQQPRKAIKPKTRPAIWAPTN